ncbi:MAG TPA: CNNM domain-containing protein, partial [Chthoniobacterales bacterium]|nr:CNNM domain-containing protein [Chthoniobacterales bacterium]
MAQEWDSAGLIFLKLSVIVVLVSLNGFFVAAEFALVKIRGSQLEMLASEGNKRALAGQHVTNNLDAYLSACQLGITLASLGLGWVGEPFLAQMLQPVFVLIHVQSPVVITSISFAIAF